MPSAPSSPTLFQHHLEQRLGDPGRSGEVEFGSVGHLRAAVGGGLEEQRVGRLDVLAFAHELHLLLGAKLDQFVPEF